MLAAMRVLDRYILTECLPTLVLSVVVFSFVLMMHRLFLLSDLVVARGAPLGDVLRLLALALPALFPVLLPVSLLLAVLLAMGRLSADSEVVVMRACGLSLAQNLRPVLALSVAVMLVTGATTLWAQPRAARAFQEVLYDSFRNRIDLATEAGVFTEVARGITVYADRTDRGTGVLGNVFIRLRQDGGDVWILAREGRLASRGGGLELVLTDGEMHLFEGPGKPYRRLRFDRSDLTVPVPTRTWSPEITEQSTPEVFRAALAGRRDARMELHGRLAVPAACLVFGLLGASLGLHHSRSGRSRGVTLCLLVLLAYYALLTTGKTLGKGGAVPPEAAMWLPDLALGAVAVYAYRRKSREAPLAFEETAARWVALVRARLRPARGDAP